jgi:hypothetical protein
MRGSKPAMKTTWFVRAMTGAMTAAAALALFACGAAPTESSGSSSEALTCSAGFVPSCTSDPDVNNGRPICTCVAVPVEQDTCTPVTGDLPLVLQGHGCAPGVDVAPVGASRSVRTWVCTSEPSLAPTWKIYPDRYDCSNGVCRLVETDVVEVWHRGNFGRPKCSDVDKYNWSGDCDYSTTNSSCLPTPSSSNVLVVQWRDELPDSGGGCQAMCMVGR